MSEPSWSTVVLVAALVSATVSLTTQWARETGRLHMAWEARAQAESPEQAPPVEDAEEVAEPEGVAVVPELIGLPTEVAAELMWSRGLHYVVKAMREDASAPRGAVLSQEPLPGSSLPRQSTVSVVVSKGAPKLTALPELKDMTAGEAIILLESAGLTTPPVAQEDMEAPVTGTDPAAGTELEPGTSVALQWAPKASEVPKVTGLRLAAARKKLKAAGFKVGKVRSRFVEERPAWAVLRQSPKAGTQAEPGTSIDLVRNED